MNNLLVLKSEIKMPMMSMPVKSLLVREGKRVVLISPFEDIDKDMSEIHGMGEVTDIIAPSGFHHMGIGNARKLFPKAKLWASPVLFKKRQDVNWDYTLGQDPWPFSDLECLAIEGMPSIQEFNFFHKPTGTLFVADLCFNHVDGKSLGHKIIFGLFGTYGKLAVSRFFTLFIKDREKTKKSLHKILDFDIKKVVIPHGQDLVSSPKAQLKGAFKERGLV